MGVITLHCFVVVLLIMYVLEKFDAVLFEGETAIDVALINMLEMLTFLETLLLLAMPDALFVLEALVPLEATRLFVMPDAEVMQGLPCLATLMDMDAVILKLLELDAAWRRRRMRGPTWAYLLKRSWMARAEMALARLLLGCTTLMACLS